MRLPLALAALLLTAASARAEPAAPRVIATLARGTCYGTCPNYNLTIFADGKVQYHGAHFVMVRGDASATLTAAELAELTSAFEAAGFLDIPDVLCGTDDVPYVTTSFDDGKHRHSVHHDPTCSLARADKLKASSKTLSTLEDAIDRIANTARWIGPEEKRSKS
jgi:hypothetical protein